jgi:2',3'-cyclic-nucleotide 2'-phosphodiesterase
VRTDRVIERFLTQLPTRFDVAAGPVLIQGASMDIDEASGRAVGITRIRERVSP